MKKLNVLLSSAFILLAMTVANAQAVKSEKPKEIKKVAKESTSPVSKPVSTGVSAQQSQPVQPAEKGKANGGRAIVVKNLTAKPATVQAVKGSDKDRKFDNK